jgi:hypothetical protein
MRQKAEEEASISSSTTLLSGHLAAGGCAREERDALLDRWSRGAETQ